MLPDGAPITMLEIQAEFSTSGLIASSTAAGLDPLPTSMLDFLGKSSKRAQLDKITSSGVFTIPSWATEAIVVVVGGGGSGGCQGSPGWDGGGGGGSGGATMRRITVTGGTQVSCTIGAGGGPNLYTYGQNGNNSAFGAIVAVGGGGGGGAGEYTENNGRDGASGGGGRGYYGKGKPGLAVGNASTNWEYQGYDGGTSYDDGQNGGGGGAGGLGYSTAIKFAQSGGDGVSWRLGLYADYDAFGSALAYDAEYVGGGGGAGGGFNGWTNDYRYATAGGGNGGWGGDQARFQGANTTGQSGTPNTGGGGGGAGGHYPGNTAVGGSGGSGVIWVLSFTTAAGVYRLDPPRRPLGAGGLISTYCSGFNLYGTYYNGAGGTYDSLIEVNSASCGYSAPLPPPWDPG